jgi:predicted nucleic acid-binding protein
VGLPWVSLMAVLPRPMSPEQAWSYVDAWLSLPSVWTPGPTERHPQNLARVIHLARPSAGLLTDGHLAAIAIEHGLTL